MIKNLDSVVSANKDVATTLTQLTSIWTAGLQEMGTHLMALSTEAMNVNLEAGRAAMMVRSPVDLIQLHNQWAQRLFETLAAGTTKLTEVSTKVATQAVQPVQASMTKTADRLSETVDHMANQAA